jgi:hypothetical protein
MMDREYSYQVADIRVRLRVPEGISSFEMSKPYEAFRHVGSGPPDLDFNLRLETPPPVRGRLVFSSATVWQIYEENGRKLITTTVPHGGPFIVDRLAVCSGDFCTGELYQGEEVFPRTPSGDGTFSVRFPLAYPLDEVLFINLLSRGRGLEFHGCGVSAGGEGMLFLGTSGAGKTTMGRLMAAQPDVVVLSDDRTIVREMEGRWWIFGTPWHGTGRDSSPMRAELKKIFVLRHAPANRVRLLPRTEGVGQLVARACATHWDPEGMRFALDLVDRLATHVPIRELGFAPTPACVDFVRGL